MASITTNPGAAPRGIFARISDALFTAAEANSRFRQVERLRAMSDAQLAARGIERDEIVRVVYRDLYYI